MKILLTNDDGIDAKGLNILKNYLCKEHQVYVVAPLTNKSGTSQSINMFKNLYFEKRSETDYALDGTPADCVIFAQKCGLFDFDLVISGINKGPNLGSDIIYSGTCGAARQACFFNKPSIALSVNGFAGVLDYEDNLEYDSLANFTLSNLDLLVSLCKEDFFVNINAPSCKNYEGVEFSSISHRHYDDFVEFNEIEGKKYEKIVGKGVEYSGEDDCDSAVVDSNKISISCVKAHPVCDNSEGKNKINLFKL